MATFFGNAVYLIIRVITKKVFLLDVRERFLLGLANALTNCVLFILPISEILIGKSTNLPMMAIISTDRMLIVNGNIIAMDIMIPKDQGWRFTAVKIAITLPNWE